MSDTQAARWPDLNGKTALVTGASSGLGAHFARVLASQGVAVTVAARRAQKVDALCQEIVAAGGTASALALDVTDVKAVDAALAKAPFDIVVNNAGVAASKSALTHDAATLDQVVDTNLKGTFHVARAAAAAMHAAGQGGAIVNIASILAHRPAGHVAAYAASKAGLLQMTRCLALEWARHGIRVNALCPGYIETDLNRDFFASDVGQSLIKRIPQRRMGQPEDLDGPLLLLVSDLGRFMTGSDLVVDGGHLVTSI